MALGEEIGVRLRSNVCHGLKHPFAAGRILVCGSVAAYRKE
jgi:hypothetical protein